MKEDSEVQETNIMKKVLIVLTLLLCVRLCYGQQVTVERDGTYVVKYGSVYRAAPKNTPDYSIEFRVSGDEDYGYKANIISLSTYTQFYVDNLTALQTSVDSILLSSLLEKGVTNGRWVSKVVETVMPYSSDSVFVGFEFRDLEKVY